MSWPFEPPVPTGERQVGCCEDKHPHYDSCPQLLSLCPPPAVGWKGLPTEAQIEEASASLQTDEEEWDDAELELLRTAWAVLWLNTDLVEWVMCYITEGSGGGCVRGKILGTRQLARIRKDPVSTSSRCEPEECREFGRCYANAMGMWGMGGGRIHLCSGGDSDLTIWTRAWTGFSGVTPMDLHQNRICAAISLASLILHELTHVCARSANDDPGECQVSYIAENNMLWALLQRYGAARLSSWCEDKVNDGDDLWYWDGG